MYKLWATEEVEILKTNYSIMDKLKLLKLLPNKSPSAILHKALRLGLKKESRWWSQKEIEILKNSYAVLSKDELLRALPLKDWVNVRHKASQLHLKLLPTNKYKRNWRYFERPFISEIDRGYLAGIIDGEGMMRIMKCKSGSKYGFYYAPLISIVNTNAALMGKIREIVKVGRFYRSDRTKLNHKPLFIYNIGSIQGCKVILEQIESLLIVKSPHAKILIEFLKIKENKDRGRVTLRETKLCDLMKKLNAR